MSGQGDDGGLAPQRVTMTSMGLLKLLRSNGIYPSHVAEHWQSPGVFVVFFGLDRRSRNWSLSSADHMLTMARRMVDVPEIALVEDRGVWPFYAVTLRADQTVEQLREWRGASIAALDLQRQKWHRGSEELERIAKAGSPPAHHRDLPPQERSRPHG